MIRRTVLEWKTLRHGDGEDCIPEAVAKRIAAVARGSALAGEGGTRVLTHLRDGLRAEQVVGVVAAEGCALEILPKIEGLGEAGDDISRGKIRKRLVYMLAVANDLDIASGSVTELGWQRDNLLEILIGLFSRKLSDAVRQGMPRRYVACADDLPALRGRLDVVRQFTALAADPGRLACRYDALSADITINQVMKAAVTQLARISQNEATQRQLRELGFVYADVSAVSPPSLNWAGLVFDRSSARWRELVDLARLLLGYRFQTTSGGDTRGFSLLFEMNKLFEQYVERLLKRAVVGSGLTAHGQSGLRYCLQEIEAPYAHRFQTRPDILIKRGNETVLIIDTKWKRISARIDDPKQGVAQADVYQMMAYGRIYDCPRLMLLYPWHAGLAQPAGVTASHRIAQDGCNDQLVTAAVDVSATHDAAISALRNLVIGEPGTLATQIGSGRPENRVLAELGLASGGSGTL